MERKENKDGTICDAIPNFISSFVDTFVDFSVSGGIFLPQKSTSSPNLDHTDKPDKNHTSVLLPPPLQTRYENPDRLIAIGDLHGDLQKSKEAFRIAGLIDAFDRWTGGSTTVVQIGDVLDRGGDELKILYFIERLKHEAEKSGGKVITMHGNHEIMNMEGDFRYVTKEGLKEIQDWADWYTLGNKMKSLCSGLDKPKDIYDGIPLAYSVVRKDYHDGIRARIAAFRPEGPIAKRFLSDNLTVLVIGESVFVHGGIVEKHVEYGLERINEEVRDWVNGLLGKRPPMNVRGGGSVVWLRKFSDEVHKCDCSALEHVLATIPGAKRMIMGHTIQEFGINGICNNKAIRIDVGMSKGCTNGLPEVLEIVANSDVRVLTSNPLYQNRQNVYFDTERKDGLGLLVPEQVPKQVEVRA